MTPHDPNVENRPQPAAVHLDEPNQPQPATVHLDQPKVQNQPQPNQEAPVYPPQNQPPEPATGYPVYPPHDQIAINSNRWNTDLFGCFQDPTLTLITFIFPCVTFGQISEILDEGQTSCATNSLLYAAVLAFIGWPFLLSCCYRTKLRARFGLDEVPAPDCLVHCLCEYCALCQAYRELRCRNLDPALGWQENQRRQIMMAPAAQVMMPRI